MSVETLSRKLRQPYPQRGTEWRVTSAVLAIGAIGVIVSSHTCDWNNFAKSGSLIVVIGIYITWKDIIGRVDSAKTTLHQLIEGYRPVGTTTTRGLLTGIKNRQLIAALDATQKELGSLLDAAKRRVKTMEAVVIGIGTIVWGFGDCIGQIFACEL